MLPASNKQAIAEINESLGLGLDQYVAQKKVEMLTDPLHTKPKRRRTSRTWQRRKSL